MLRISGYGQTGPYRDLPGFGAIGEAMGGLRHLTGEPGRVPVRCGISIGDTLAALHGTIGILTALYHRKVNGGQGQVIDVALQRGGVQRDGEPDPRVQRVRRGARGRGQRAAGHRAVERLPLRRRLRADRRQRRQHLQAADADDRPRRSRHRPGACRQRRPRRARRRTRRGDRGLDATQPVERGARACWARRGCRPARSTPPRTSPKTRTTARAT